MSKVLFYISVAWLIGVAILGLIISTFWFLIGVGFVLTVLAGIYVTAYLEEGSEE